MINNMDLIREKLAYHHTATDDEIIKTVLKNAREDPEYLAACEGLRYYRGMQDILQKDFRETVVYEEDENSPADIKRGGVKIINENNSNHHNVHNFHALMVDQKVAYILGKPLSVSVEGANDGAGGVDESLKAFEDAVTAVTSDEAFVDMLPDLATNASNCIVGWLHVYYSAAGKLCFVVIPTTECIACRDMSYQQVITDFFRHYKITVVQNGTEAERERVEWWTATGVKRYVENDAGEFVLESNSPHWYNEQIINDERVSVEAKSWGRIPFVPLYNNSAHQTDLSRIKGLLDAYNLISSASTNNQIDLVELYWMIQGYGGETAKAIQQKLQINKAVSISDPSGKISAEQVTLNVTERLAWLDMLRRDIYHIGRGIDMNDEKLGSAPSGVSLKFRYTLLDLKADPLVSKLKVMLKELSWFITQDINLKNGTDYDYTLIKYDVHKSMIVNDAETVDIIQKSQGLVPDKMLLAKHPFVDDVAQAYEELQKQREENAKMFIGDDDDKDDSEKDDE